MSDEAAKLWEEIVAAKLAHQPFRDANNLIDYTRMNAEQRRAHEAGYVRARKRLQFAYQARQDWLAKSER